MKKLVWKRVYMPEFWPFWIFYFPAYFYYFLLAIKSKRWVYFSNLNSSMKLGGAFLSSKNEYLKQLPKRWTPITLVINNAISLSEIKKLLRLKQLHFPLIIKPDMGERGKGVEKLESIDMLSNYLNQYKNNDTLLIQEFIDYPIELGVLFYWDTEGKPKISSIGEKSFCEIEGNGKDTLKKLVLNNYRVKHREKIIQTRFKTRWNSILPCGEKLLIEPIGNHNRGTVFLDARAKFTSEMLNWVAQTAKSIPDFDYGRFDLKINNWDAFRDQTGIKVMEVNGVNSEPIHIYDPNYSYWRAQKDIVYQIQIIFELSQQKLKEKKQPQSLIQFIKGVIELSNKKHPPLILKS